MKTNKQYWIYPLWVVNNSITYFNILTKELRFVLDMVLVYNWPLSAPNCAQSHLITWNKHYYKPNELITACLYV